MEGRHDIMNFLMVLPLLVYYTLSKQEVSGQGFLLKVFEFRFVLDIFLFSIRKKIILVGATISMMK